MNNFSPEAREKICDWMGQLDSIKIILNAGKDLENHKPHRISRKQQSAISFSLQWMVNEMADSLDDDKRKEEVKDTDDNN